MMMNKSRKSRGERAGELLRALSASEPAAERSFRVLLSGSAIGGTQRQRATLRCLGLLRRGAQSLVKDSPQTRGRLRAVAHLISVEEA